LRTDVRARLDVVELHGEWIGWQVAQIEVLIFTHFEERRNCHLVLVG